MRPALMVCGQTLLAHTDTVPRVGDTVVLSCQFYRVAYVRWDAAKVTQGPSDCVPLVELQATVRLERV